LHFDLFINITSELLSIEINDGSCCSHQGDAQQDVENYAGAVGSGFVYINDYTTIVRVVELHFLANDSVELFLSLVVNLNKDIFTIYLLMRTRGYRP